MKFYSFLPQSKNWKFWIILALLVKCSLFFFNLFEFHNFIEKYHGSFLLTTGDTFSYFDPIDEFISRGDYLNDFRMPGYGLIYYIFRLTVQPSIALNFIGFLQLLLSSISVYTLGLLCQNLFKSMHAFLAGFFIYLISIYTSIYDSYLLTESLCTSFLIFSIYFFTKQKFTKKDLFLSGLFITWSIFLRPVIFPILILQTLLLFIKPVNYPHRLKISTILYFLIPFLIVDGAWVIRNEIKHKKFIPLQENPYYPGMNNTFQLSLCKFFQAFEGWEAGKDLKEFLDNSTTEGSGNEFFYPKDIYTSTFTIDSLKRMQKIIEEVNNPLLTSSEKESKYFFLREKFFLYANSIKEEKPFVYYFESRVRASIHFLFQSGSTNLFNKQFSELTILKKTVKLFYSILYYFILVFGTIGLVFLLITGAKHKDLFFVFFSFAGLYLIWVYPLIFKAQERRYFVTAYPLFIVGAVYTLLQFKKFIRRKKMMID